MRDVPVQTDSSFSAAGARETVVANFPLRRSLREGSRDRLGQCCLRPGPTTCRDPAERLSQHLDFSSSKKHICVSFRSTLKKHREHGRPYLLRISKFNDRLGDFIRQLLSAYRLLHTSRIENPDLCGEWLSLPVSDRRREMSALRTCLLHDAYPGHFQAPSERVELGD